MFESYISQNAVQPLQDLLLWIQLRLLAELGAVLRRLQLQLLFTFHSANEPGVSLSL